MDSNLNVAGSTLSIGSASAEAAAPVAAVKPPRVAKPADKRGWWWGTGRRKTAVARVRIRPAKEGAGTVVVHRQDKSVKTIAEYFCEERDRNDAVAPLTLTKTDGRFDVIIRLHGGGLMGQSQAVMLGLARALRDYDPSLDSPLREAGMLTRDSRAVERKKYGQSGARRRFQFSKR